jgi:Domain of unknown function (DUF305)
MLRFLRPNLGMAFFGARLCLAFTASPFVLAQEAHPGAQAATAVPDEASFLKENEAAMTKMMNGMDVKPSGDIDRDFVAMMAPHHQGAIDMAVIELRYGKNEQLRRIAQEIIVDQMQEIQTMNLAIGNPVAASAPAPTQQDHAKPDQAAPAANGQMDHMGMHMDMSNGMKK